MISTPEHHDPDTPLRPHLTYEEMGEIGVVQEINRQLLHPVGLALARHEDGSLHILTDPDPEGWNFQGFNLRPRYATFLLRQAEWHPRRRQALGYVVQPIASQDAEEMRLWGTPGAERMELEAASAYESQIDGFDGSDDPKEWVLEEWSVAPRGSSVPVASSILEWMVESAADELVEGGWEDLEDIARRPEVIAAAETLRQAMASRVRFWMADDLLATHSVTFDDAGEPLLDGEPMYERRVDL